MAALLRCRHQSAVHLRSDFQPQEGFNQSGHPTGFLRSAVDASVQTGMPYLRLGASSLGRFRRRLRTAAGWKSIWIYMDDDNCLSALTRGDSNTEAIAVLAGRIWASLQRYHISAWFSRVPSNQNPAYLPTRKKTVPFPAF